MSCQMQPVTLKDPIKIYTASKMRVHVTPKKFTPDLQIFYTFPVFGLNVKKITPDVKKFTPDLQIFYTFPVFGLNVHVLGVKVPPKCNEKDNFHKALHNVKKAYVTLRKFTPNLKIFYTDISAISVTFYNSVLVNKFFIILPPAKL